MFEDFSLFSQYPLKAECKHGTKEFSQKMTRNEQMEICVQFYEMQICLQYQMSVNLGLTNDINTFLNLLQKNTKSHHRTNSLQSDKLSIIYSATEQSSSSEADKENSRNSSNKVESNCELEHISQLFKEIKRTTLSIQQEELFSKLQTVVDQLKKQCVVTEGKLKIMELHLADEKKGNDEILQALVKMDESEKELWTNYSSLSEKHSCLEKENLKLKEQLAAEAGQPQLDSLVEHANGLEQELQSMSLEYKSLEKSYSLLQNELKQKNEDIEFMRKLVLVANQNYENMEKKCKDIEKKSSYSKIGVDRLKEQKSSPDITSRSRGRMKTSCSPTVSDKSMLSGTKSAFEENYRRLVLRTLKGKSAK